MPGGEVVFEGGSGTVQRPTLRKLANPWVIIDAGGGPTRDRPTVTPSPPDDPARATSFIDIRVADVQARYEEWRRLPVAGRVRRWSAIGAAA